MIGFRGETAAAVTAVHAALQLARDGTGAVRAKAGRDIVTDADVAVEDHLRRALTATSAWPVIGEERGGQAVGGDAHWLVDPICGIRNFASGVPLFAINVALVEDGRVTAAVIGDGSTGEVLAAEAGRGAWNVSSDPPQALQVSPASLTVDFGAWPPAGPERDRAARGLAAAISADRWDIRCLASTLALAYLAAGRLAGCVLFAAPDHLHVAAGTLLVTEAGGRVTDGAGRPWDLRATSLVCAGSDRLHADLLRTLHGELA